jgi:hypothetical protein
MAQFLGLELNRHREVAPWAKAWANPDIAPWQKEGEFPSTDWMDPKSASSKTSTFVQTPQKVNRQTTEDPGQPTLPERRVSILPDSATLENTGTDTDRQGYFIEGDDMIPRRKTRLLPKHTKIQERDNSTEDRVLPNQSFIQHIEVKRSWPEPREKGERRMISANYSAVEIHGFFGLIDDGSDGSGRMLVVHVPRWVKGYFMDIKQGDVIHVYHARGLKIGAALTVLATGRHKYYGPGRRVTTCTICVPEEQWAPFAS